MKLTENQLRQIIKESVHRALNEARKNNYNAERREKYANDPEYREKAKQRSRDYLDSLSPEEKEKKMQPFRDFYARNQAFKDMNNDYNSTLQKPEPYKFNPETMLGNEEQERFDIAKRNVIRMAKRKGQKLSDEEINNRAARIANIRDYSIWKKEKSQMERNAIDNRPTFDRMKQAHKDMGISMENDF